MTKRTAFLCLLAGVFAATPAEAQSSVEMPAEDAPPADCPALLEYGDPSHPSHLRFLSGGMERVLHLERVAVSIDPAGTHTFHIPAFGAPEGFPMQIGITARPSRDGYDLRMSHTGGVPSDCVRIMPDVRWDRLDSAMEVLAFEEPGDGPGRLSAEIRFLSMDGSETGLVARIESVDVTVLTASGSDALGTQIFGGRDGAVDTVAVVGGTAVYHSGTGQLELRVASEGGRFGNTTLGGVTGAPQVVSREGRGFVTLYEIETLSSGGLAYDWYIKENAEPEIDLIFERPDAERSYDLSRAEWRGRVEIPSVVIVPELPALSIGDPADVQAAEAGRSVTLADLSALPATPLAVPAPGRVYFDYAPGRGENVRTEVLSRGEEAPFVLEVAYGLQRPEGESAPEPDPAVAEVEGVLMEVYGALMEADPREEAVAVAIVQDVLRRRGLATERDLTPPDLGILFDGGRPFFFERYDEDVVAEAFRRFEAFVDQPDPQMAAIYEEVFGAEAMPADRLELDGGGAPLRRVLTEHRTAFEIEYGDGHAWLRAENEGQGTDTLTIAVPAGTLDILQWNEALTRLPLAEGSEHTLAFLDLHVHLHQTMGTSGSRQYVRGTPELVAATVRVTGRETVEAWGETVSAYRAEVHFDGQVSHPVMTGTPARPPAARGREASPFVYLLSAEAPHRVLRVEWGEEPVQRALR